MVTIMASNFLENHVRDQRDFAERLSTLGAMEKIQGAEMADFMFDVNLHQEMRTNAYTYCSSISNYPFLLLIIFSAFVVIIKSYPTLMK